MKKVTGMFAILAIGLLALLAYIIILEKADVSQDTSVAIINTQQNINQTSKDNTVVNSEGDVDETETQKQTMKAVFTTNKGNFEIELFDEIAPKTVENFVQLAESNFYNGVKFHRVIENFMIQAGDPQSKDDELEHLWGTGGPGYTFEDEIHAENFNLRGTISMANAGPNTNGSQFFINTNPDDNNFLDTKHTVFGKVISGMDVVDMINTVETFPNDRPIEPVVIESITVVK